MRDAGDALNDGNKAIIEKYVFTQTVPDYLVKITKGQDADMARRATAVLKEIERYWGIKLNRDSKAVLPIL